MYQLLVKTKQLTQIDYDPSSRVLNSYMKLKILLEKSKKSTTKFWLKFKTKANTLNQFKKELGNIFKSLKQISESI